MKFRYQARTKQGEIKTGIVEASSREAAIKLLQKFDLYVTLLKEERGLFWLRPVRIFPSISLRDIFLFFRQLAVMYEANIPIDEILHTLASQTTNPEFSEKISEIAREVEAGSRLSRALSKHPKIFPRFYTAIVESGEAAGKLSQNLKYLADYLERRYNLEQKLKLMMLYPALVLVVFLAVAFLMFFVVFPSFEKLFAETNVQLPLPTKIFLATSRFLREEWPLLFFPTLIVLVGFYFYTKTREGKVLLDYLSLRLPIIGPLTQTNILSRFCESFYTLTSGGILITQALEILEGTVENALYKETITNFKEGLKKGLLLSSLSFLYPKLYPPIFNQMIAVGEKTGNLDLSLKILASFYQEEVNRRIDRLTELIEPLLIICLGLLVAFLAFSLFLPLYRVISAF